MKTVVPVGTWVRYRYRGTMEYAQVTMVDGEKCIKLGPFTPPNGTKVQPCIWKGNYEMIPKGKEIIFKE